MPYLQMPSGRVFEAPEGMDYAAALAKAQSKYPQDFGIKPQEGVGAEFKKGWEQLKGSTETGIRSLFGNAQEAAAQGAARNESIGSRYADQIGWDKVTDKFNAPDGGLFSAAGEFARQVPLAIAGQAPNIAATMGSAGAGAMAGAPLGPVGSVIGGAVGALAPSFLQQLGGNVERQQEVTPGQINVGNAAMAAAPQAALDAVGTFIPMGRVITGKVLGPTVAKFLERGGSEAAERLAKESLLKTVAKGTAVGVMAEVPTEVVQQMLERHQAGLSLTDADAQREYAQTAYQTGLLGPIGAAGRYVDRSGARTQIETRDRAATAKAAKEALDAENAKKQTPEYLQELTQNYDTIKEQRDTISAQIKALRASKKDLSKDEARDVDANIKTLGAQLKTAQAQFGPVEREYGERKAQIDAATEVPPEYGDLAKQKPFTPQAPQPLPPGMALQPGQEIPAGYEDLAISGEQRAPGVAPRVPSRLQPAQYLTQFTSPEARMAGEQFPDWQTSVSELVKRPDVAQVLLSSGERFPGASNLAESNLWKKNLATALREKMQQPNLQAEMPEQDTREAQIVQEAQAQQAERARVAQARQQQDLLAQGNQQMAETAQQKIAAEQQAFQERLAQQREQDATQEAVAAEPEVRSEANSQLRNAEALARRGLAPYLPKAHEALQQGKLTREARNALGIQMGVKIDLDLTNRATAKALLPVVNARLAALEGAVQGTSAFEITDAQGNLTTENYQRALSHINALNQIKEQIEPVVAPRVFKKLPPGEKSPALQNVAETAVTPIPQLGTESSVKPLEQAHDAYTTHFDNVMSLLDTLARGEFTPSQQKAVIDRFWQKKAGREAARAVAQARQGPMLPARQKGETLATRKAQMEAFKAAQGANAAPTTESTAVLDARQAKEKLLDAAMQRIVAARASRNQDPLPENVLRAIRKNISSGYDALVDRARRKDESPRLVERVRERQVRSGKTVTEEYNRRTTAQRQRVDADPAYGQIYGTPWDRAENGKQADKFADVVKRFTRLVDGWEGNPLRQETLADIDATRMGPPEGETPPADFRVLSDESLAKERAVSQGAERATPKAQLLQHVEQTLGEIETMLVRGPHAQVVSGPKTGAGFTAAAAMRKSIFGPSAVRSKIDMHTRGTLGKVQQFLANVGRGSTGRINQQFLDDVDAIVMRARNLAAPDPELGRRVLDHIKSIERNQQDERYQGDLFETEKATPVDETVLERARAVTAQEKANAAKRGRLSSEISNLETRIAKTQALLGNVTQTERARDESAARVARAEKDMSDFATTYDQSSRPADVRQFVIGMRTEMRGAKKKLAEDTAKLAVAREKAKGAPEALARMQKQLAEFRRTAEAAKPTTQPQTDRAVQAVLDNAKREAALEKKRTTDDSEKPGPAYIAPEGKVTSQPAAVPLTQEVTRAIEKVVALGKTDSGVPRTLKAAVAAAELRKGSKLTPAEKKATREEWKKTKPRKFTAELQQIEEELGRPLERSERVATIHDLRKENLVYMRDVETTTGAEKARAEQEGATEAAQDRLDTIRNRELANAHDDLMRAVNAQAAAEEAHPALLTSPRGDTVKAKKARTTALNKARKAIRDTMAEVARQQTRFSKAFKNATEWKQAEWKKLHAEGVGALHRTMTTAELAQTMREMAGAANSPRATETRKNLPNTGKGGMEIGLRASKQEASGVAEFGTPPEQQLEQREVNRPEATIGWVDAKKRVDAQQTVVTKLEDRRKAALKRNPKLTMGNSSGFYSLTQEIVQEKKKLTRLQKELDDITSGDVEAKQQRQLQGQIKLPIDEAPPASDAEKLYNEMQDKLERGETDKHFRRLLSSVDRAGPLDTAAPFHGMKLADAARWGAKNARGARAELFNALADIFKGNDGVVLAARFHGFYEPNDNFVVVPTARTDTLGILLHELTHAATSRQMHASPEARAKVDALRKRVLDWTTTPEGRAYVRENSFGLKNDKSEDAQAYQGIYGLKNEGEFLAETFSNRQFQKMLAQIPSEAPKTSVFRKFVDFVAALLKIDSPHARSALNDAIETTLDVASEASGNTVESMDIDHAPKYAADYDKAAQDIENRLISTPSGLRKNMRDFVMGFRMHFIDAFDPVQKIADGMADSLKALQMMYDLRMYKQASNATNEVALNGNLVIDKIKRPDGRIERMVKSKQGDNLRDMAKELKHAGVGDLDAADRAFKTYMIAERAESEGYESVVGFLPQNADKQPRVTEAELKDRLAAGRANPVFQKVRGMYKNYADGLIDFAVETGAIPAEEGKRLKAGGDYVSFYRQDGDTINLVVNGERIMTVGSIKSQPYLKNLVGSTSPITGFLEGALQNTRLLTEMALRNMATKNTAETLTELKLARIQSKEIAGKNVIHFRNNGQDKYAVIDTDAIGVPTEVLVTGLEGVATQLPAAFRLLGVPSRMLRQFIVRNPLYAARQVVRDSLANSLLAGVDGVPVASTVKEIAKMLAGRSNAERELQERLIVGGQALTGDMDDKATILKQIGSGKLGWQTAMGKLDFWAMQADAAARVTAYNSARANGLTDMEATMAALETMNFNRRGVSPTMHALGTMIPFMNAQIQGLDVLYRAFTGKMPFNEQLKVKQKLVTRGLMLAATTMAYAAMMEGDDDYENASMLDKLNNWFIPVPGTDTKLRVPIPFEAGYIFKALPEALFTLASKDGKSGEVLSAFGQMAMNTLPGVIPQGVKPMIEHALNREFYTGRDIEDARMEGLKASERYGDRTSEIAKTLGGSFEIAGREIGVSPVQIDHMVRGYTGALGMAILGLADGLVASGVAKPTRKLNETPILGPLFVEKDASAAVSEAYKMIEQYGRAKASFDKMVAEGRGDDAERFADKFGEQIARADTAGKIKSELGRLTKMEQQIRVMDISGDEKRESLDDLRREKIALSREAMEALRE